MTPWREGMREAVTRLAGQKGEDSASGPRAAELSLSHSFVEHMEGAHTYTLLIKIQQRQKTKNLPVA